MIIGDLEVEKPRATQFLIAAGASVVMGAVLPDAAAHAAAGQGPEDHGRHMLGLDALVMLKKPSYLVFVVASILACIPLTFYFSFTNAYLNEVGVNNAAGKMTLGQVSEVGVMLLMP